MDRYQGPQQMDDEEAHALALLQRERAHWERDQQAISEYESWHAATHGTEGTR